MDGDGLSSKACGAGWFVSGICLLERKKLENYYKKLNFEIFFLDLFTLNKKTSFSMDLDNDEKFGYE